MVDHQMEEIIEIEQNIMSGVDPERTEPLQPEAVLKQVLKLAQEQREKPEVLIRVFSLLLIYYEVPDKTYKQLLNMLDTESVYGQALTMLR